MISKLQTARTIINIVNPKELSDVYFNALNDPQVIRFTEARHQRWSKRKAIEYLDKNKKTKDSLIFSVKLKANNKVIGNVRVFSINKIHQRCDLSFLFFDKNEWFKGYATEAIARVCDFCFNKLDIHRICADYYSENVASKCVFEKLGFSIEGIFRNHFKYGDRFIDSVRVAKIRVSQ